MMKCTMSPAGTQSSTDAGNSVFCSGVHSRNVFDISAFHSITESILVRFGLLGQAPGAGGVAALQRGRVVPKTRSFLIEARVALLIQIVRFAAIYKERSFG